MLAQGAFDQKRNHTNTIWGPLSRAIIAHHCNQAGGAGPVVTKAKMMNPWIIEIEGEPRVLEKLEPLLRSSPRILLQRHERSYELRSSEFDSEADPKIVRAKAEKLVHVMSGSCRLAFGLHGRIKIRGIRRLEEEKPPTQFVFLDAPIPRPWGEDLASLRKDEIDSSHGFLESVLDLIASGRSEDAEKVIRIWDRDVLFADLTSILEIIRKDVGRGNGGIANVGGVSKAKVDNIFRTAQSPAVLGDDARHGTQKNDPPSTPISLEMAREVTAKIIQGWLAEKSTAK
jgi:hypothetical protein